MNADEIIKLLSPVKFNLQDEKLLQQEIHNVLKANLPADQIRKEHHLDKKNIPDFFLFGNIAVEIKIKGRKVSIYKQCVRYCGFDEVKELILVTNVNMGFPEQINNKNCYVHKLSKAWL